MDILLRPTKTEEVARYKTHNNNVEDKGYQNFVSPITSAIFRDFKTNNKGLDFGAGTGPVISKVLKDKAYNIKLYDPFFHNYPKTLEENYDFIACCEVIEHFYHPNKEFKLLYKLLNPNGKLYCMTLIYDKSILFDKWFYKNDSTHVFIYQKETLYWIKKKMRFKEVIIKDRLITFTK